MENEQKQEILTQEGESTKQMPSLEEPEAEPSEEEHEHHHHHSHHSHHHSGHHSHKKKSKKRRKCAKKFRDFVKKNPAQLIALLLLATTLGLLLYIALRKPPLTPPSETPNEETSTPMSESLQIATPFFTNDVSLVPEAVNIYLASDLSEKVSDVLAPYRKEGVRLDSGLSVNLEFGISGIPSGYATNGIKIEIDESASFSSPRVFRLSAEKHSLSVPYLKTATEYFYRITFIFSNGQYTASVGSFVTADTPRLLTIDGLVNVRDIGNWKTTDGKTVRQGMIIRGSELDGAVEKDYSVTSGGLFDALTVLGIRTDMDLRASTDHVDNTHALGANVTHKYYEIAMYEGIFSEGEGEKIRTVFSDLAKPENYPIYLHCTYGADRTGTVCYLLEGFLGLSEEDLIREYELTALYHQNVDEESLLPLRRVLDTYPGDTLQEKCKHYLLSIGVTEAELQSIRTLLLDD